MEKMWRKNGENAEKDRRKIGESSERRTLDKQFSAVIILSFCVFSSDSRNFLRKMHVSVFSEPKADAESFDNLEIGRSHIEETYISYNSRV